MNFRKIVKYFIPRQLFRRVEPLGHFAEAVLFNVIYGFPAHGMKVIGVTGTNGKTTTAFLIHRMLLEAGYKTGLMTTVAWGVGQDIRPQIHHMTTVPVPQMMRRLKHMRREGVEWLVLETTSMALVQSRVWGVPFSVAVLTNITHEHLDYHRTFERYREAKRRLFKLANRNKKGLRTGVINADDPAVEVFAKTVLHPITYGVGDAGGADLQAVDVVLAPSGVTYSVVGRVSAEDTNKDNNHKSVETGSINEIKAIKTVSKAVSKDVSKDSNSKNGVEYTIQCNLPGSFNVSNSLAAVGVGRALGLSRLQIETGIAALDGVEGRMTRIDEGQEFHVIVDYAHSPDSFEKLFIDLRPTIKGRMIVLFGSQGGGDTAKRSLQGALAGKYADEVVITEEDDRAADGLAIMGQIAEGAEKAGKERDFNLFLVHDRTEAIAFAVSQATDKNDTVLLLGKGHEKTIERADGEHPWDEAAVARMALRRLLGKDQNPIKPV